MIKKRKPRLNTCDGCITPYRYISIVVKSCKKVGSEHGLDVYEVIYVFSPTDYYHDVYGDKEFNTKVMASVNICHKPYKVGRIYRIPMSIDI